MPLAEILVVTLGLVLFEIISSIDNAVVNADVLATMSQRARHWFLFWGILIAVVLVRGLLPLVVVFAAAPDAGIVGAFTATWSNDPMVHSALEAAKPILLSGGGIFLLFLFLHWLFDEDKKYAFFLERHIHHRLSLWFYAIVSIVLMTYVWTTISNLPAVALGAVIGSSAFFITNGFKKNAAEAEKRLTGSRASDAAKILYLELIDATFSIDGVFGAFAFTLSVPLILLGNGIGAVVVRYVTVHGIKLVKRYAYLKNGAMYSVGALGIIMMSESVGREAPAWLSPLVTFVVVGIFLTLSLRELKLRGDLPQ